MNVNTMENPVLSAKAPFQKFKNLSRFYGEPLYPGEHEFVAGILRRFDEITFRELVEMVDSYEGKLGLPWEQRRIWRASKLSPEAKERHYAGYAAQRIEAGRADVRELRFVLSHLGLNDLPRSGHLLDLGTGRGSFFAVAQREPLFSGWHFEGADMDMASLLINLKLNEDMGNRGYNLTCSFGERLPYDDNAFDIVASFQTLEHVGNTDRQAAFIREACRCLRPGGVAMFTFPNRFDVLRPEPHVYIRCFGFVPQRWKDRVSRALRGVPSSDVYPPNPIALLRSLRSTAGVQFLVRSSTELANRGLKKWIGGSALYRMFGPWNVLIARKAL